VEHIIASRFVRHPENNKLFPAMQSSYDRGRLGLVTSPGAVCTVIHDAGCHCTTDVGLVTSPGALCTVIHDAGCHCTTDVGLVTSPGALCTVIHDAGCHCGLVTSPGAVCTVIHDAGCDLVAAVVQVHISSAVDTVDQCTLFLMVA